MNKEQVITFEDFPDSAADEDSAEAELLGEESKPKSHSLISLEFYQQFFDVDTRKVCQRLFWSMVPHPRVSYLQHHIRPKPDLYGPLWTCLTLVFSVAISGNLAIYIQLAAIDDKSTYSFKTDFRKVSYAASAFISYILVIPMMLWAFLWWRRREHQPSLTLLEAVCLYGYSLAIYIPVSILLVVDIVWLRWSLVLLASCLSGSVLVSSLWPAVKGGDRKIGAIVSAVVIGFHVCVAVLFMMLLFLSKPPIDSSVVHPATEKPLAQGLVDAPKEVSKPESGNLVLSRPKESPKKTSNISGTDIGFKSLPELNDASKHSPPKFPQPDNLKQSQTAGFQPDPSKQSNIADSQFDPQKQMKSSGSQPDSSEQSKYAAPQPVLSKQSESAGPEPNPLTQPEPANPQPNPLKQPEPANPQPNLLKQPEPANIRPNPLKQAEQSQPAVPQPIPKQSQAAASQSNLPVNKRESLKESKTSGHQLDVKRKSQSSDATPHRSVDGQRLQQ